MEFRPCIDIHNGKVKQIIGSTLRDEGDVAGENFVSERDSTYYANLYREYGLSGGHVIILNHTGSEYYVSSRQQAVDALAAYPGGLMVGGGINADNAAEFLNAGASHVIATSYVFSDGAINMDNLKRLFDATGGRLVLDLSCKKSDGRYLVATDRWQKITDTVVDDRMFDRLSDYCDEYLVHAIDSEGRSSGVDEELIGLLAGSPRPVTYAGGVSSLDDIRLIRKAGRNKVNFTVGSKLDIFGGNLRIEEIVECTR